jgi:hypothetical protein
VALLAVLALLAALAHAWDFARRFDAFDFYQFWIVGRAAAEPGTGDVWSQAERERLGQQGLRVALAELGQRGQGQPPSRHASAASRRQVLETYSTPWLYTLFGAAASGDYERDLDRFQLASLIALAAGAWWMARAAGLAPVSAVLLIAFSAAWFAPALSDARVGNVNRLQLGLLGLFVALAARAGPTSRWRALAAGALLGAGAMFKPNLAFPMLTLGLGWIALGRWRKLALHGAGAAAGALVAFALSSVWLGSMGAWSSWGAVLGELMGEYEHTLEAGNFSLARVLERSGLAVDARLLGVLSLIAFAAALMWRRQAAGRGGSDREGVEDLLLLALGGALSVLAARLAWLHYFVLVLPLAIAALRPGVAVLVRAAGACGLLLIALEPLRDALGFEESSVLAARLVCAGAALLFLAGLYDLAALERRAAA